MAETISPQAHQTGGNATVLSAVSAYDKNYSSTANLIATAPFTYAELQTYNFEADSDPVNRTSVTIRIRMAGLLLDHVDDLISLLFKEQESANWTILETFNLSTAPVKATWKEYDVAALVGSLPASGFQFAGQFAKQISGGPPVPEDP